MISGTVDPRFAAVRDALAWGFAEEIDHGAAVCAVVDGRVVVDLWAGHADAAGKKAWQRDTLVNVWSVTKGIVALAVAMLVERGKLDYAAPIASVWPEFAANGKEKITLELAMSHRAGLNGLSVPMTEAQLLAWTPYVEALAAMAPLWEPGSRCVYHMLSYGHLAGEPIRRVTGASVGRFIADNIAAPLGVPFFLGLPEHEDLARPRRSRGHWSTAAWTSCARVPIRTAPSIRGRRRTPPIAVHGARPKCPAAMGTRMRRRWRRSTACWRRAAAG